VTPLPSSRLLACLSLALLSSVATADTITGRVVDSHGQGVAGVDLDVEDLINGGDPGLANGGTDAGGFFNATLPAGFYRVTFTPPAPPATTHLVAEVDNVSVVGTAALGDIVLPPGVSLSGRLQNQGGFPIQNVDIDVIDRATGVELLTPGDATDAFGMFSIAVPARPLEVQFETANVVGATLAPVVRNLSPSTNTNLGNITLVPGFVVSGTVHNSLSAPVQGVDFDAIDSLTGEKAFTPRDNSNSSGNFSFVVAAGTWNFEACPRPADRLAALTQSNVPISGDTNVGIVMLQDGVRLFGTIRDANGDPVRGADVDLARSSNGSPVTLCTDDTDGQGNYSVIVPTGTFDIVFGRPQYPISGTDLHPGVVVSGDMRVDGVLENCPCTTLPFAGPVPTAGTLQRSRAEGAGSFPRLRPDGGALELTGGVPGGTAVLFVGPENDWRAASMVRHLLTLDELGSVRVPLPREPLEAALFARVAVLDRSVPRGFTVSSGVRISPTL